MNNLRILSALIGLVGAVSNNGKTENTDKIVKEALLSEDSDEMISKIHEEKFTISPNCRSCTSPCGNTSDYDMSKFNQSPEDIIKLKNQMMLKLNGVLGNYSGELPDAVYRAIAYMGYDLVKESYIKIIEELDNLTL